MAAEPLLTALCSGPSPC
ncbi:rCG50548 [Rattus norvegicus]|uniref:RCG50548 n=1 Tax=Rattus norvegicus TaxID=10116 RepID=A6KCQ9_RAT|nr:rCG50548 [Rattus norvegicus]